MSPYVALRWSSAVWSVPVLFLLGVFVGLSNADPDGVYPVSAYAAASRATILVGPLLACLVAARTATLLGYLRSRTGDRSPLVALGTALWPLLVLGPLAGVASMVSCVRELPRDPQTLAVLGTVLLALVGCALVGAAASAVLPVVAAVPLVGLGTYAWLTLPATGANVELRNLNASFVGCCTLDQQPAAAMLLGSSVLLLVLVTGLGLVLLAGRPRLVSGVLTLVALTCAGTAGHLAVTQAPGTPTLMAVTERHDPTRCGTEQHVTVCVWPEHRSGLPEALRVTADVVGRLRAAGLDVPARYSERLQQGYSRTSVASGASATDLRISLVVGLLPNPQDCRRTPKLDAYAVGDQTFAWLALRAGVIRGQLTDRIDPAAVAPVVRLMAARSPDGELRWYLANRRALEAACGPR